MGLRVAIVGAGYAGMAAAVTLAAEGARVTVLEAGPVPGGRARRVLAQGNTLDNGQHVLIGAYTGLLALMRKVGVPSDAVLRIPLELQYAKGFRLRALWLPPPIGLAGGLLCARGVPFSERLGALRFLQALRRRGFRVSPDGSVAALLEHHGQRGAIGRFLWEPLCVSALNTPVDQASAQTFLAVLRDTLAGGEGAADLLLPRRDLSQLFPEPAAQFVARHGGEVRLRTPVSGLGELKRAFDAVVVAVGPHQLKTVLPSLALGHAYQPIYTCYLQYEQTVRLRFPMLGLCGGLVQWVFDRGALLGEHGRLACVISAEGPHQQLSLDEIVLRCQDELREVLRGRPALRWARTIAEKRATIACTPNRPRAPLEHDGVVLAGDYADPDYPPTLEAAVRSGVRAAQHLLTSAVIA